MKSHRDPEGYKQLLVYRKAGELHSACLMLAQEIKRVEREKREVRGNPNKIPLELADQIGRAARSPKSNIVEGQKRNTTKEYYDFLSFSIGSVEEIHEDMNDIIRGKYPELMGQKGITGLKGMSLQEANTLPFYPLSSLLPLAVEVKLRCKELSFLLYKLQESLEVKRTNENNLSRKERLQKHKSQQRDADNWLSDFVNKNSI